MSSYNHDFFSDRSTVYGILTVVFYMIEVHSFVFHKTDKLVNHQSEYKLICCNHITFAKNIQVNKLIFHISCNIPKPEYQWPCSSTESIHPQHSRISNSKANCLIWNAF